MEVVRFELLEPAVGLDAGIWHLLRENSNYDPLNRDFISIMSICLVARIEAQLGAVPWDPLVICETYKLRKARRKEAVKPGRP